MFMYIYMYTGEILNNEMECQKNILIKEELCDCIRKENKKKINRDSKKREKEIQKLYLVNLIFFFHLQVPTLYYFQLL